MNKEELWWMGNEFDECAVDRGPQGSVGAAMANARSLSLTHPGHRTDTAVACEPPKLI